MRVDVLQPSPRRSLESVRMIHLFAVTFALIALLPVLGGALLYIERTSRRLRGH